MRRARLAALALLALLLPGPLAAQPAGMPPPRGTVTMLIGNSLPPYIIEEEGGARGFEFDIAQEALALAGFTMAPRFVPFARVPVELGRGLADAALTVNASSGLQLCYSDTYIVYRNYAISLASRGLQIAEVTDLRQYSVRAFQNARLYLGPDFAAAVEGHASYTETPSQLTQNSMLFAGRVDVVVGDINIFNWYSRQIPPQQRQPVALHPIFLPVEYKVGFRDPAQCQAFNQGLAQLRASGRYDAIIAGYTQR